MGGRKQTTTTDQTQRTALDVNQSQQAQQFLQQFAQNFLQQQQTQQQQQQARQQQTGLTQQQQQQQAITGIDPRSQAFVDQLRAQALQSAQGIQPGQFAPSAEAITGLTQQLQNPFTEQVIGAQARDFERAREAARTASRQQSTLAGAFGGERQAITEATRLAELDAAQAQQAAQLRNLGFTQAQQAAIPLAQQQALAPAQAAAFQQQLLAGGLGPTGTTQTVTGTQRQQQQQQMQSVLNQLSNLFGTQMGTQTGTQFGTQQQQQQQRTRGLQELQGTTTQQQGGFGFGDLLGGVLTLAGAGFNPISAISGLFGGGGGGSAPAAPAPQVAPIDPTQFLPGTIRTAPRINR